MFGNLGNIADIMKNAGKIRETVEKATEALGSLVVEGSSGGGAVTAKANGRLELISVRIDPNSSPTATPSFWKTSSRPPSMPRWSRPARPPPSPSNPPPAGCRSRG